VASPWNNAATMSRVRPLFVFSLPRTGSTFLQGMLHRHSQISTPNETWLLLPYLYSLRAEGVYAEYGHRGAAQAITELCRSIGGRDAYLEEVRELALRVYQRASAPGSVYFVDKTPRYHLVVEDILTLFEDGRFVFLWRNPLAVVASMLDSGIGVGRHKIDLFAGLANLVSAFTHHGDRCLALRYEDLVADAGGQMSRVLGYLELPGEDVALPVDREPLEKWQRVLGTPLRRAWCRRYLRWIGDERLRAMGYDLNELLGDLSRLPVRPHLAADLSLAAQAGTWLEPTMLRDKAIAIAQRRRLYHHW
jgi:sulfotransferase family protein